MIEGLEFLNQKYVFIGIFGAFIWVLDYFNVFKKSELEMPSIFFAKNSKGIMKSFLFLVIGLMAWGFLTLAIMQPRKPMGKTNSQKELNDIYFVVDVSQSMLATDFNPNRLEAAKDRIRAFIKLAPVDRIGIIMFADKVFTIIPATTDLGLVEKVVDEIRVGFVGNGTNIGDALGLAVARSTASIAENKSIILLTDGASNVGTMSPMQAAEKAKENGIKVYTIGIGGDVNAKLPNGKNAFGQQKYRNIPGGSMDFETLEEISKISGGKSFIASDDGSLDSVLSEINKLERKKIDVSGRIIYEELYLKFLIIGFVLLLLVEFSRSFVRREAY